MHVVRHLATLLLLLAACGGKAKPASAPALVGEEKRLVEEAEAMSAAVCACKDLGCVVEAREGFSDGLGATTPAFEITDEGARRWGKAMLESHRCMLTAVGTLSPESQQALDELGVLRDRACACADTTCTDAVMTDFMALGERHKNTKGSDRMVEQFKATFEEMTACVDHVRRGDDDFVSTGLPSCDAYIAAMDRYLECDKIPQATRDAARQGMDAMKHGWGDVAGLPKDVREQAEDACRQSLDALQQGATALGCTI
jgi:hypothetical protein